ncbi:FecR family protein [Pacificimonas flava]|uniref:Transcriptional regulator, putative n=1 Tax=Pacificimonas flava TaxID=1234595 RepID=M2TNZ2_9SPHN|nr:FecR domain-containing protein [Pacificimonas flava]EMD83461.1 transcriptional regulator, putative [Pacificimonas flava]MBB5278980.1 transmembrane sensor [Pacificimonas flava]
MTQLENIEREAATWLDRMNRSAFTPAEGERFDDWMKADSKHRDAFAEMAAIWYGDELAAACEAADARAQDLSTQHISAGRLPGAKAWRLGGIATALGLCAAGTAIVILPAMPEDFATAPGENRLVELADGSTVELGGNTAMTVQMLPWRRRVDLARGEAYFDVAHEEGRPFRVQVGDASVNVLGTAFLIDRMAEGQSIIGVTRGRVRVGSEAGELDLAADEALRAGPNRLTRIDLEPEQAMIGSEWFLAKDAPLPDLVEKLGRYSTMPIVISPGPASEKRVTGRFNISNVDTTLLLLENAFELKIIEKNGRIHIS